jgi:hypothetical protein
MVLGLKKQRERTNGDRAKSDAKSDEKSDAKSDAKRLPSDAKNDDVSIIERTQE